MKRVIISQKITHFQEKKNGKISHQNYVKVRLSRQNGDDNCLQSNLVRLMDRKIGFYKYQTLNK